jgi:metallo-beta-lactamase class B
MAGHDEAPAQAPGSGSAACYLAALVVRARRAAEPEPAAREWNQPQKPFKVFGNTYWVGTSGLGAVLITSDRGHILIDGALPESVPQIRDHIRELGFKLEDVRLLLNTHVHYDHAGGSASCSGSPAPVPRRAPAARRC